MKLIICDYFRRRWHLLTLIFIGYFILEGMSAMSASKPMDSATDVADAFQATYQMMYKSITIPIITFLAIFLIFDFKLGFVRVLNILPMTAKETGRSLWLAYVAVPSIVLLILGTLASITLSSGIHGENQWSTFLINWIFTALALGGAFGGFTFASTMLPDNSAQRVRSAFSAVLPILPIFVWIVLQLKSLTTKQLIFIFTFMAVLSLLGWFRAERIVRQRANPRLNAATNPKRSVQHKVSGGIGGLPFLIKKAFLQTTLFGLGMLCWMMLVPFIFNFSKNQSHAQMITSLTDGGSVPYFFVLLLPIFNIVFQLRILRTLPIKSLTLAAVITFLPVFSTIFVGAIVTTLAALLTDTAATQHVASGFLLLDAKAAAITCVIVWRGLDGVTYLIGFLIIAGGNLIFLAANLIFHIHKNNLLEFPWWICLIIFLASIFVSLMLTKRLITKSSCAYRPRTMPANTWSMMRRY